jgi:N-acylneuraminate cytidylyltransferase
MITGKSVLAIIPARGGSKGLPGKNIKELCGKPLIAWTIEQAKSCSDIDRIVVSTDDSEIAEIAKKYGAEVPFIRPAELASDTASTIDVIWFLAVSCG